jgi:hypothetical protein
MLLSLASSACAGSTTPPPARAPIAPATDVESALAAATVDAENGTPPIPAARSATRSGGCVIPCGTSGGLGALSVSMVSDDPTYGYTQANPVRLKGVTGYHEDRYLRGLWGPDGQPIEFERIGSCCPMEDGLLDAIRVTYEGAPRPIVLYLDIYHEGPIMVPVGLTGAPLREVPAP